MPETYIGTSGFSYSHWRGPFYPEGLSQSKWFGYYCERFSTVELNVTFYRLPEAKTFRKWLGETPEGFRFALKGSRFITHLKKLKDPSEPLRAFFQRASELREKLGVVLWQLPPSFGRDEQRLEAFLRALGHYGGRNAFEFRNDTWLDKTVIDMLREHGAGMCMADWPPFIDELPLTADFVYIRRHGRQGSYATRYSPRELRSDAGRVRKYRRRRKDVYMYFNNDYRGYAALNALEMKEMLGA